MESSKPYNISIYVGTVRGVLASTRCEPNASPSYTFGEEKSEITALEWIQDEDIVVGYKNGITKLYSTSHDKFTKTFANIQGDGAVVGVGTLPNTIVIARHSGVINICKNDVTHTLPLSLGDESTLECMTQSSFNPSIIGVGGEKNDLKLWDINSNECVFKAKSLGHDQLNLSIPTSVRGITFLDDSNLVCCATKEGHVLLYDSRAQRKPTGKFQEPKASYSTITATFKEKQCVVGTTKGYIQLIDLRMPVKCVRTYKSFTGGVTSIVCDPVGPYVISTSLDKHLRIHNLDSKELLYKKYMKQSLTKVLIKPIVKNEVDNQKASENIEDEGYEEMFNEMEVVQHKQTKRKSIQSQNYHVKKRK